MFKRSSRLMVLLLALAMLALPTHPASAAGGPPGPIQTADRTPTRSVSDRWIVRLNDPPLAQARGISPGFVAMALATAPNGKLQIDSPAAQQYRAALEQQQTTLFSQIQRALPGARLQHRYQIVFNGLSVALPGVAANAAMARLKAMPGVAAVYPEQRYQMSMFDSIPQIGADKLWASRPIGGQQNAGKGIKIAIIDSGIKIDNPFFNPAGFSYPPGYPKGDTAHTTPKVIAARAYFRPDLPPLAGEETPEPGPTASSHGTHVAGTAAGVANTSATIRGLTEVISGVAPRAYLMNYKVFYENDSPFSGQSFTTESLAAFEDAVADDADVINNSWGGRPDVDPRFDPIAIAAEAAVDAGVTVIFASGNDGPNPSTAGSPGFSDKLISVGATTTAKTISSGYADVTAPEGVPDALKQLRYGIAAFGPPIVDTVFGPAPYLPVVALGLPSLACDPLPEGSLSGQVALIERGTCAFSLKVYNAQQAGASAAIIYNSEAGGEALIQMAAGDRAGDVTIPSISLPHSVGLAMIDWYSKNVGAARVQIDPRPRVVDQAPDVMAAFSSRGPTFQHSLKPDVVAPGVNILSSGFAEGEGLQQHLGFGIVSGTSMAAPHVTGAAALLKQIHPSWSPADIKSALMSTAATEVWLDQDHTQPASVLDRGAGRIQLDRAASPGLLFDRPALSFGNLSAAPGQPAHATLTVSARNSSGQRATYTITTQHSGPGDFGVSVSAPSITLAPGAVARFDVSIDLPSGAAPGDYAGQVDLQGPGGDAARLHLPLWARLTSAERNPSKVLLIDNDGSSSLGTPDYSGYYGNALGDLGVTFTYLDADALAGQPQTLPDIGELQRYEIVIWFTGDYNLPSGAAPVPTPLTEADQNLLIAYLQAGGNLIATGQDLAQAADINRNPPDDPRYGRSDLYHVYLGARFVQDDIFTHTATLERSAIGTAAQGWLPSMVLDLSAPSGEDASLSDKTGAGNQSSIDEVTVPDSDSRSPDLFTTPILRATSTNSQVAGIIGVNRAAEPTLEQPAVAIPYRSTYLAFGLEGVRNDTGATTRQQLLQNLLYWHVDRPTVQVSGPVTVSNPNQLASFTATAETNTPATFVRYRWDFGDGSPILETDQARVVHQYDKAGTYQARVEATDSWGHRAIASSQAASEASQGSPSPKPAAPGGQGTAGAQGPAVAFAETGQSLQGRFLEYWRGNGGLPVFGYPISAQSGAPLAQAFERARFEYHPENQAPYDVLLGRLGVEALQAQGRDWQTFDTVASAPAGCRYFAETKHSLCGAFAAYWQSHGLEFDGRRGSSFAENLALFGLPISEPRQEIAEGGQTVLVQWFERARFEYHPENQAPYDVLLGRLGSALDGGAH
jgi:subtilisin family serine protease